MLQNLLCKNLRKIRHHQNWKREQLAHRLGVSISTFSAMEAGLININLSFVEKIAEVYEVPMAELFNPEYSHLNVLKNKVAVCETEIWFLQGKIIELYEELLHKTVPGE